MSRWRDDFDGPGLDTSVWVPHRRSRHASGTAQLHQQLVFRPVPGLGRAETPVRGLFLGSASAHPGGGVHGACGDNAARAALAHARLGRLRPRG